jgi:hypothetical protein
MRRLVLCMNPSQRKESKGAGKNDSPAQVSVGMFLMGAFAFFSFPSPVLEPWKLGRALFVALSRPPPCPTRPRPPPPTPASSLVSSSGIFRPGSRLSTTTTTTNNQHFPCSSFILHNRKPATSPLNTRILQQIFMLHPKSQVNIFLLPLHALLSTRF